MGAFVVNFHVRTSSQQQVAEVLQAMSLEAVWIAGAGGPWVSFWEAQASHQDIVRIQELAQAISQQLEAPVIGFLNHDSDFICYWLFDNGQLLDEYHSCPGYFDGDSSAEETLAADCQNLVKYCKPGTSEQELEEVLKIWTQADAAQGIMQSYVFAEERLSALGKLMEIDDTRINVDYGDIGRDVPPEEIGAEWIGTGEPSDNPGIFGEDMFESDMEVGPATLPPAPLHEAARRGDIETIERLVAEGTDIDEANQYQVFTPLTLAAHEASPEVVRRMIELGASIDGDGGPRVFSAPLGMAVLGGKLDNVKLLVEHGADVNVRDPEAGTLLHVAAMKGSIEMVTLLLELGADLKQTNLQNQTPLEAVRVHRERIEEGMSIVPIAAMPAQIQDHIDAMIAIEKLLENAEQK